MESRRASFPWGWRAEACRRLTAWEAAVSLMIQHRWDYKCSERVCFFIFPDRNGGMWQSRLKENGLNQGGLGLLTITKAKDYEYTDYLFIQPHSKDVRQDDTGRYRRSCGPCHRIVRGRRRSAKQCAGSGSRRFVHTGSVRWIWRHGSGHDESRSAASLQLGRSLGRRVERLVLVANDNRQHSAVESRMAELRSDDGCRLRIRCSGDMAFHTNACFLSMERSAV